MPRFKTLTRIERDNSFYVTQQVYHLRCALLNVRSLKNKCDVVSEYISDHNIDILCLTESWIDDKISDLLCLKSATPSGYSFISVPRKSDRSSGLVLIYKSSIRVRLKPSLNKDSFESMLAEVVYDHIQMGMVLVYRPPSENFSTLLTEFGQLVTPLLIENSSRILCLGDFNIHADQENDLRTKAFNSLLSEIGLLQHVCFPTLEKGHTLDLVLTDVRHPPLIREPGPTLQGYVQSDHYPPCFDITCPKPHKPSKIIKFRKCSNLDLEHFKSKLTSSLADSTATSDANNMVDVYNQTLQSCLDDLLPVRSETITEHFNCPYYSDEIRAAKQRRRKLERQWRKSRSDHHRALYVNQCKFVTTLLKRAKAEYYQTKVIECKTDQKALFRVLNELMHRNNDTPDLTNTDHPVVPSSPLFSLSTFKHVTEKAVEKAVQSRPSKHCPLDPVPMWLLKNSIDILAPYLTELVNQSFSSGVFPYDLKTAILKPLVKRLGLDPENCKNLRPISNIAFLSKLLESLACERYETALVRVHNDIMGAFDEKKSVILVLLDLSGAFDTVDHDRLLTVLNSRTGITGAALSWFESY